MGRVESFLTICIRNTIEKYIELLDRAPNSVEKIQYENKIKILPNHLKEKLLVILNKREKTNSKNLNVLLSNDIRYLDWMDCGQVSDECLKIVAHRCKKLQYLNCSSLKFLNLSVSDEGVKNIADNCPYLLSLHLKGCSNITNISIAHLASRCIHLIELNLCGCNLITDKSLEAIGSHCMQLESLNLSKTKITDLGIYKLTLSPVRESLKELYINSCPNITEDSIFNVFSSMPSLIIFKFHDCPLIKDQSILEIFHNKKKHISFTVY